MNSTHTFRTSALIALPFLLLPAGVWLANTTAESWYFEATHFQPWQGVRWLLRLTYVWAAILGWRARRPIWFYPWLGFAIYEVTAVLILLVAGAIADLWVTMLGDGPAVVLGQFLFALLVSLSPTVAVILWRTKQPLHGPSSAFILFPPAALTLPLLLSVIIENDVGGMPRGMLQLGVEGMPPFATLAAAVTAAIFAVLYRSPPRALSRCREDAARIAVLLGAVPVTHLFFWIILITFSFGERLDFQSDSWLLLISTCLGWLILTVPMLLPPLLNLPARILRRRTEGLMASAFWGKL